MELKLTNAISGFDAAKFVAELTDREIVIDERDDYGKRLIDCISPEATFIEVMEAVKNAGLANVTSDEYYQIFIAARLCGDYDCPLCGGEMEIEEEESTYVCGDGYESEREYDYHGWKKCPICGCIEEF